MEFVADRDVLKKAASRIQGVGRDTPSSQPIFGFVRIHAKGSELELVSGNSIVSATTVSAARVSTPGAVCVPFRPFRDAIDSLPPGDMHIRLNERNRVAMAVGRCVLTVAGRCAEDYPTVPAPPAKHISLPAEMLRLLLLRTTHASSKNIDLPSASCVYIRWNRSSIAAFAMAMDGSRAAEAKIRCTVQKFERLVVHRLASLEIQSLLFSDTPPEQIHVSETQNYTFVRAAETVVAIRKMDANTPEIPAEMKSERASTVQVQRSALLEALRVSKKMTQQQQVWISVVQDGINISSDSRLQDTSVEDHVPGKVQGMPMKICANGDHIMEGLEALETDDVLIGFGRTPHDPISLRGTLEEDVLTIFMPMNAGT